MNYKRITEIDYVFWIEFIIRTYFVPVIAFLVTWSLHWTSVVLVESHSTNGITTGSHLKLQNKDYDYQL